MNSLLDFSFLVKTFIDRKLLGFFGFKWDFFRSFKVKFTPVQMTETNLVNEAFCILLFLTNGQNKLMHQLDKKISCSKLKLKIGFSFIQN